MLNFNTIIVATCIYNGYRDGVIIISFSYLREEKKTHRNLFADVHHSVKMFVPANMKNITICNFIVEYLKFNCIHCYPRARTWFKKKVLDDFFLKPIWYRNFVNGYL